MTLKQILFPTDFSEHALAMKPTVEWLAARFGCRVTLLHVFDIPFSAYGGAEAGFVNLECFEKIRNEAKRRIKTFPINVPEVRVERLVMEGNPARCIAELVRERDFDLIVMGSQGYGKMRGLVMGSTTAKVLHEVGCPVWTNARLSPEADAALTHIGSIVCALELTEEAAPLLRFAKKVADDFGSRVTVVHSTPRNLGFSVDQYFDEYRYIADELRTEFAAAQREAGTNFPLVLGEGTIAGSIADVARSRHADLVIVGRGKCQEAFGRLRTQTDEIIREAPCPVLSYAVPPASRTSSSCSEAHPAQCATNEPLLTDSRTS